MLSFTRQGRSEKGEADHFVGGGPAAEGEGREISVFNLAIDDREVLSVGKMDEVILLYTKRKYP